MSKSSNAKPIRPLSVIEKVRIALQNPTALLGGSLVGGLIPFLVFHAVHQELDNAEGAKLYALYVAIAGGLLVSAKTVWQWTYSAFQCKWKATGFVAITECMMLLCESVWVPWVILGYLAMINAIESGCVMAQDDKGKGKKRTTKAKSSKVRNIKSGKRPARKAA